MASQSSLNRVQLLIAFCVCASIIGCDPLMDGPGSSNGPDFTATLDSSETVPTIPEDRGNTGYAEFRFLDGGERLEYKIWFDGLDLGGIKGNPATADTSDDITKMHIHNAEPGVIGDHVLNIFGAPSEDDDNMVYNVSEGLVQGIWDDGDANMSLPDEAQSHRLSEFIDELCAGNTYLNVHSKFFNPGEVRGQIRPTSEDVCEDI